MTGVVLFSLALVGRIAPGQPFTARGFLEAVRGLVLPLPGRCIQVILLALFVALQIPLAVLVDSLLSPCLLGTHRRRRNIIIIRLRRYSTLHNRRGKCEVCSLPFFMIQRPRGLSYKSLARIASTPTLSLNNVTVTFA